MLQKKNKRKIIEQIQATGVPLETIQVIEYQLFLEGDEEPQSPEQTKQVSGLENIPYDVFVSLVRRGEITGKDLINICQTSSKFNSYCNRSLELPNGQVITKYLFRQLLDDRGITYSETQDPQEIYNKYSRYHGFNTVELLELAAQILQNQVYKTMIDPVGAPLVARNLRPYLLTRFPRLPLPAIVTVRVIKDLVVAHWINDVDAEYPFSPRENQAGRPDYVDFKIEDFRPAIYDFVMKNLSWLVEEKLWPPPQFATNLPNPTIIHNLIFTGTGISRNRIRREGFHGWLEAVLTILTITDRNHPWVNKLTKK